MTARACLLAGLLPAVVGSTACEIGMSAGGVESTFDRDLTVSGPVELAVQSGSGDIQVRTGPGGTVHVHGRARTGIGNWVNFNSESAAERVRRLETDPPIEQSGNVIRIGQQRDRSWDGISISYEITVPATTKIKVSSGSGDLAIGEVAGPVTASTGSGDIRVGRVADTVEARSGSGEIEVIGAKALLADTGSGNVHAMGVRGSIQARSGSGDISVGQEAAGRVDIGTGSGDVTVTGARGEVNVHASSGDITIEGTPAAPWDVSASSGDVRLRLPAQAAFELDAHSNSGRIDTALPVTTTGAQSRRELKGRVGGGGPHVQVSTSSGDIEIR